MLVDANILLFAADRTSPHHAPSSHWLETALGGIARVGLPWESLVAFVRIATNPRVMRDPVTTMTAWGQVRDWLAAPAAWVPTPTVRHDEVLGALLEQSGVTGDLVHDAHLAALAIEHGVPICSADSDFARFRAVEWVNPLG
ncbi:MAG: PIN domain-containing protein [Gaiella sp.]|nr:PIN domain-containing protein [Gaiella sp.]